MSLAEYQSSERDRQLSQWRAARARIESAALVKTGTVKPVDKIVDKLVVVPVVSNVPMFVAPGGRDWLEVSTKYPIADILKEVGIQFGVSKLELLSARRQPKLANARQVAMALCKHLTSRSLPEIGRHIGNRDHTTVLWACRKYQPVLDVVVGKVRDGSPISEWVKAFKAEIDLTGHAKRKRHVRKDD